MAGASSYDSRRRCRGFTLIELLVVISLISVLISILLPALKTARESGMTTQSLSNLRQIQTSLLNYATDNGDFLPCSTFDASSGHEWAYVLSRDAYILAADSRGPINIFWGPFRERPSGVFTRSTAERTGYSANWAGAMPRENHATPPVRLGAARSPVNGSAKLPAPSELLVITESLWTVIYPTWDGYFRVSDALFTVNDRVVGSYLDGHAALHPSEDMLWNPTSSRSGSWIGKGQASLLAPWFYMGQ